MSATKKSPITTHVLDTSIGRPAAGVAVRLMRGGGEEIGRGVTDEDGRIFDLMEPGTLAAGVYRIRFETAPYFAAQARESFYPSVEITFSVREPSEHYHVPLLLNPFGYSTYRGS